MIGFPSNSSQLRRERMELALCCSTPDDGVRRLEPYPLVKRELLLPLRAMLD